MKNCLNTVHLKVWGIPIISKLFEKRHEILWALMPCPQNSTYNHTYNSVSDGIRCQNFVGQIKKVVFKNLKYF
jgi:hypothetical protein